ncbi:MAG: GNAT family N-acetyltransferase [Candidatus Marinimicrobia bacterium]|nr:GNAT family N-acetyltransferase [Candidatus Neomarinimicrobiota bacterium]
MADHDLSIEPAVAGDLAAIVQLLGRSGLEADGLEQHLDTTLVARRHSQLVASAGLELYGRQALLRSVVVAPQLQGTGLGRRMTGQVLALAQTRGITRVYLLTETAREFFARFGFRLMERADVPVKVQSSQEFSMACANNAVGMWAPLENVLHGFK